MRILIVCLGNICRSPLAEGILKEKIKNKGLNVVINSAGTGSYHIGEHPDKRAIQIAKRYGIDISQLRARQFSANDFDAFDRIYVMDNSNLEDVISQARNSNDKNKVKLFLEAARYAGIKDVPDPWYGGMNEFEQVFNLLNEASGKIADSILKEVTHAERK